MYLIYYDEGEAGLKFYRADTLVSALQQLRSVTISYLEGELAVVDTADDRRRTFLKSNLQRFQAYSGGPNRETPASDPTGFCADWQDFYNQEIGDNSMFLLGLRHLPYDGSKAEM